jgi:hypothetical protein
MSEESSESGLADEKKSSSFSSAIVFQLKFQLVDSFQHL